MFILFRAAAEGDVEGYEGLGADVNIYIILQNNL
jgi:hypothetical protein